MLETGLNHNVDAPLDVSKIKQDFPILNRLVHGKRLVYLDNAATSQKPRQVIEALVEYYSRYNSNIHRSVHVLAEEATEAFESTRSQIQHFINAKSADEIIFTKNATEALNVAARNIASSLHAGDKVLVTEMDHHSNFVPWQQLAKEKKLCFEIVATTPNGEIDEADLEEKLEDGAKVIALPHMSNVLGTINEARKISKLAHEKGALVVLDGAQSSPHLPINLQDLDCDYFALSAHKMLGPTGLGCLYGRRELLESAPPFLYGGDMIREVHRNETRWNDLPWKYEAGTSNIADVIAFSKALDYLTELGMENVAEHEQRISRLALDELGKIEKLQIYGPLDPERRGAVFSFNLGKVHAHDVASILDSEGIAIRSGHHCAQVLMEKLQVPATSRASFYLYNDDEDLSALVQGLKKVDQVLS